MAFNPFAECADDSEMNVLSHNQSVLMFNKAIIHNFVLMTGLPQWRMRASVLTQQDPVDEPGDNIVKHHYSNKDSNDDQDESFTCRQNQFSLGDLNFLLTRGRNPAYLVLQLPYTLQ